MNEKAAPTCRECGRPLVQKRTADKFPRLRLRGLHFSWGEWRGYCVSCGALNKQPPTVDNTAETVLR